MVKMPEQTTSSLIAQQNRNLGIGLINGEQSYHWVLFFLTYQFSDRWQNKAPHVLNHIQFAASVSICGGLQQLLAHSPNRSSKQTRSKPFSAFWQNIAVLTHSLALWQTTEHNTALPWPDLGQMTMAVASSAKKEGKHNSKQQWVQGKQMVDQENAPPPINLGPVILTSNGMATPSPWQHSVPFQ